MKLLIILLFCIVTVKTLDEVETRELNSLSKELYEVEDKLDHLMYHHGHDVTRHNYKIHPNGMTTLVKDSVNPNSINQKLILIDELNNSGDYSDNNTHDRSETRFIAQNMPIPHAIPIRHV